jgi:hypothetical protein
VKAITAAAKFVQTRLGRLPGVVAVGGVKPFVLRRNADQQVTIEGGHCGADERLAIDAVTPDAGPHIDCERDQGAPFLARSGPYLANVGWVERRRRGTKRGQPSSASSRTCAAKGLDHAPIASAFVPDVFSGNFDLTVRAAVRAVDLIPSVRREIRMIDAALAVPEVVAATDHLSRQLGGRRLETYRLSAFAAVGVLLAATGLYASLAYRVALRTRESGIRAAWGAPAAGQGSRRGGVSEPTLTVRRSERVSGDSRP